MAEFGKETLRVVIEDELKKLFLEYATSVMEGVHCAAFARINGASASHGRMSPNTVKRSAHVVPRHRRPTVPE